MPSDRPKTSLPAPGLTLALLLPASLLASCLQFPGRQNDAPAPAAAASGTGAGVLPQTWPGTVAKARQPLPGHRIGTVQAIGTQGQFVLVEITATDSAPDINDGQLLRCVGPGGQAAIARVARERRAPFVVADVVSGTPHAGDEVYFAQGTAATIPFASSPAAIVPPAVPGFLFPTPTPAP